MGGTAAFTTAFTTAAAQRGFRLDDAQRDAAAVLAALGERLTRRFVRRRPGGVYLYGPAGRGKTFLADTFCDAIAVPALRVHCHAFFDRLHGAVFRCGSVEAAVAELIGHARLVVFDEFHVATPGDAALVTRLLDVLADRRVALVATSNDHPDELLPDPLYHHLFLPGIAVIKRRLDVVAVAGSTDHRTRGGPAGGFGGVHVRCTGPGDVVAAGLAPPSAEERAQVRVTGRTLPALAVRADSSVPAVNGEVWFDFGELCERPTSTHDYLALAERFGTWVLSGVRPPRSTDGWQRLVNLVDVLHDRGRTLHLIADRSLPELLAHRPQGTDRTASRLGLLRESSPEAPPVG